MALLWLLGTIYATIPAFWLVLHPFANYWRRRRNPFPALLSIWLAIILLVLWLTWPWHHERLYTTLFAWILAVLLFACAVLIYRRAGHGLTRDALIGRTE